ncbi:AAA-domain-containing protein [Wolfiporia cocos MD-104 SS10]|uniref:Peroxisomal ATPase PEX1 n=1 Tax=Wolfiporia cocos (strain MD-104) TaxID=742152 RepID=A0A2H3IYD2_WOLCO|nr:AAA-domain-containing protein [Wolfiporia cocos MD-104 SS10]
MPRRARVHFVSLHSSLVNLPISLYGPLVERGIRPQSLAVHLTLVPSSGKPDNGSRKAEAYVGWTGMTSASSLARFNATDASDRTLETIDIDPQFAEGLGFVAGDVVEIGLLHDLGHASSVTAEPVTSDDWEIIELHASHLENTLINQVRVAVVGQEVDVWVFGRTRVRLKVVALNSSASGNALLLAQNTEVSIAPKPHKRGRATLRVANGHTKQHGTNGKVDGVNGINQSDEPARISAKKHTRILRVLPHQLFNAQLSTDESEVPRGYVSNAALAAAHGKLSSPSSWRALVRRLKPPTDPTQEQSSTAAIAPPTPRVLIPNGSSAAAKSAMSETAQKGEVVLTYSANVPVPDGHVIFIGAVEGVDDWDLVSVTFLSEQAPPPPTLEDGMKSDTARRCLDHGLAGVDDLVIKCTRFCLTALTLHALIGRVQGVSGLLITGKSGAGKTSLLHAIARSMQTDPRTYAYTLYMDMSKHAEATVGKIRPLFKYLKDKAAWHRPCVLVLDNIDKLMGAELEHADSFRSRHITELFLSLFGSSARSATPNNSGVVLLAAAESQAALHPSLNSSHIFQEVVSLKPPDKAARRDILGRLVRERVEASNLVEDPTAPLNFTALATQTEGYSVTDLKDLVARAIHQATIRSQTDGSGDDTEVHGHVQATLTFEDFKAAQVDFVPLSLRDVKLQKSEVEWADIGGLRETKRVLRETLEWPTKYGPIFAQSPLRLRSGLLLYGYPGCGKTLLASAVAKECGLNFISIKGPELLNKYIGASEKSVRDIFERANAAKPCVLFFDEFDSIAPKRGHDSTGVTDRVVNQMLTQMDGAEGLDGVYVLAATSRPDLIDSALLRPGRLDKSLLCDMPDVEEREEILQALRRKVAIAPSVDLRVVAEGTEGFSGADLQALVYNAHLEVVHDTIAAHPGNAGAAAQNGRSSGAGEEAPLEYTVLGGPDAVQKRVLSRAEEAAFQRRLNTMLNKSVAESVTDRSSVPVSKPKHEITEAHLRRVFGTTRPSVPPEERERLRRIYTAFVSDRSGELPVPPEGTDVGSRASLM